MKLKYGDRVTIKKPKNINESPTWVVANGSRPNMDVFDGFVGVVSAVYPASGHDEFEISNPPDNIYWTFSSRWATKVDSTIRTTCNCKWKHCREKVK